MYFDVNAWMFFVVFVFPKVNEKVDDIMCVMVF